MNQEISAKQAVGLELQQMRAKFNEAENSWTCERKQLDEKLRQVYNKLEKTEAMLSIANGKLEDTSKLDAANKKLAKMEDDAVKLRSRINVGF